MFKILVLDLVIMLQSKMFTFYLDPISLFQFSENLELTVFLTLPLFKVCQAIHSLIDLYSQSIVPALLYYNQIYFWPLPCIRKSIKAGSS